jgi:hypothetical protein
MEGAFVPAHQMSTWPELPQQMLAKSPVLTRQYQTYEDPWPWIAEILAKEY